MYAKIERHSFQTLQLNCGLRKKEKKEEGAEWLRDPWFHDDPFRQPRMYLGRPPRLIAEFTEELASEAENRFHCRAADGTTSVLSLYLGPSASSLLGPSPLCVRANCRSPRRPSTAAAAEEKKARTANNNRGRNRQQPNRERESNRRLDS